MSSRRASDVVKDMQCPPGEGEPMVYLGRVSSNSDSTIKAKLIGRSLDSSDDRTYDLNIEVPLPRRLPKKGDQVPDDDVMYPTPARNPGDAKFQVPDFFATQGVFVEAIKDPNEKWEDSNYNDPELKFANDNPKLSATERKATKSQKGLKIETPHNRSKRDTKPKQSKNRRSSKKKSSKKNKKSPRGKPKKSESRSSKLEMMDSTLSEDNSSEGEDEVFESVNNETPSSKKIIKLSTRKRTTDKKSSTRSLKGKSPRQLMPKLKKRLDKAGKKGHLSVKKRGTVRRQRRGRGPPLPHNLRKLLVFPLRKIDRLIRLRIRCLGYPPIRLAKKFVAEMAILLQVVLRRMIVQACATLPVKTRISRAHVKEAVAKDSELEMLDQKVNNQHLPNMRK